MKTFLTALAAAAIVAAPLYGALYREQIELYQLGDRNVVYVNAENPKPEPVSYTPWHPVEGQQLSGVPDNATPLGYAENADDCGE